MLLVDGRSYISPSVSHKYSPNSSNFWNNFPGTIVVSGSKDKLETVLNVKSDYEYRPTDWVEKQPMSV